MKASRSTIVLPFLLSVSVMAQPTGQHDDRGQESAGGAKCEVFPVGHLEIIGHDANLNYSEIVSSADGGVLAKAKTADVVQIVDLESGKRRDLKVDGDIFHLEMAPNGSFLLIDTDKGHLLKVALPAGTVETIIKGNGQTMEEMAAELDLGEENPDSISELEKYFKNPKMRPLLIRALSMGEMYHEDARRITPDSTRFAYVARNGQAYEHNAATGTRRALGAEKASVMGSLKGNFYVSVSPWKNGLTIDDLKTKTKTFLDFGGGIGEGKVSEDGRHAFAISLKGKGLLYDRSQNKVVFEFPSDKSVEDVQFTADGKYLVMRQDNNLVTVSLADRKVQKFPLGEENSFFRANYAGNGKVVVANGTSDPGKLIDIPSGKEEVVQAFMGTHTRNTYSSGDHAGLYYFNAAGDFVQVPYRGTPRTIPLPTDLREQLLPKEGRSYGQMYEFEGTDHVSMTFGPVESIFDGKANAFLKVPLNGQLHDVAQGPDGRPQYLTYNGGATGRYEVKDQDGKVLSTIPISSDYHGGRYFPKQKTVLVKGSNGPAHILRSNSVCLPVPGRTEETEPGGDARKLGGALARDACKLPAGDPGWAGHLPPARQTGLKPSEAVAWLLYFQKQNAFDPKLHAGIAAGLVQHYRERFPGLTRELLKSVQVKSNQLFEHVTRGFENKDWEPVISAKLELKCSNDLEDQAMAKEATQMFETQKERFTARSKRKDWRPLDLFRPQLAELPKDAKENFHDVVTQSLTNAAMDDYTFRGIFPSKVYKFAKHATDPIFGEPQKHTSDLTFAREASELTPMRFSTDPFQPVGDQPSEIGNTEYGFFAKSLPPIKFEATLKEGDRIPFKTEWDTQGKHYTADADIVVLAGSDKFVPKDKSLPYDKMWGDGKFSTLVVTGSNLRTLALSTLKSYRDYHEAAGFEFADPVEVPNLKAYLKDKIAATDKVEFAPGSDLFIKEAHSDGDEKNLFRIDNTAKLVVGTRKVDEKTVEEVLLVYPSDKNKGNQVITNREFGTWIREREKAKVAPLGYLNTSCWSVTKAIHEIEAAHSTSLINIPATTSVRCFANSPSNGEFQLLTAIREKANYEKIREKLGLTPLYKRGTDDRFIFPDDDDYDRQIRQVLKTPLDWEVKMTQDGKPYSFEGSGREDE